MRSTLLSLLALGALSSRVMAFDNVPNQCQSVCNSLDQADDVCDDVFDNNDNNQRACICNASGAQESIPLCAACWNEAARAQNNDVDDDDFDDNDAVDLLRRCSLSAISTYNLAAPSPTQTVVAATSITNGTPSITAGPTSSSVSASVSTSTASTTRSDDDDGTTTSSSSSSSSSSSTSTPNAGPTAGPINLLAGAGLLLAAAVM